MKQKTIYISGPITGIPGAFSAAQFARAERDLRGLGYHKIRVSRNQIIWGGGITFKLTYPRIPNAGLFGTNAIQME
jgi:hypothetical protein